MRIGERGQITIPADLRASCGLKAGDEVELTPTEDGLLIRTCAAEEAPGDDPLTEIYGGPRPADDRFARVRGILARPGVAGLPIEDVDQYIEEIRGR